MRSGFVSLIGRPNCGKSTLINTIVKEKIAITSSKPQTTRNLIQGIYNEEDVQIVFVDTPGIHKPVHKLGNKLNAEAYYSMRDVDVVIYMISGDEELGSGDQFIINLLKQINVPVILAINKIDNLKNEDILKKIDEFKDLYDFSEIVPISALKDDNVDRLIEVLKKYLPDNVRYFPFDEVTSSSKEFRITETVREKIFELTKDEVPYSIAVTLTDYEEKENIINIYVDIIVDREQLKKIIVGKKGSMLKEIGINSRIDLEKQLGKQVYLELYVKTLKNWRDKEKHLNDLGFNEINE
jgi:GTPase